MNYFTNSLISNVCFITNFQESIIYIPNAQDYNLRERRNKIKKNKFKNRIMSTS